MLFYASPSVTRILGWAPEEMNGSCFLDRLHPEDAPRCSALFAQIVEWPGTSISTACRYQTKRGDWVWIEGTGTNLLQEPGVEGVVLNFRDVTERRRMEEELHARAEALAEADRAKDRFLAMLAHELRNPLAPILSAVELLKRSGSTEPHVTLAQEVIERQASHQARLLEDLLHVSRIARGQISLHSIRLDLVQLVHDTVEDHRRPLEGAGLELRSELPGEPVWVEGDPTRLAQVLGNLLQNAAKFTDPGGRVVVTVKTEEPATAGVPSGMAGSLPAPGRAGGEVAVTVRDTGIGIDAEMLERIFETFTQADGSLERSRGGLGLGLALVRGLVALHGGRVRAESAGPGQGAVFTFWLPVCDAPAAQLSAPGSRLPARTVPAGSREPERSDHSSAPDSRGRG
jgi:PAS domain S-box-containing protein